MLQSLYTYSSKVNTNDGSYFPAMDTTGQTIWWPDRRPFDWYGLIGVRLCNSNGCLRVRDASPMTAWLSSMSAPLFLKAEGSSFGCAGAFFGHIIIHPTLWQVRLSLRQVLLSWSSWRPSGWPWHTAGSGGLGRSCPLPCRAPERCCCVETAARD